MAALTAQTIPIKGQGDAMVAAQFGRYLAAHHDLSLVKQTALSIAILEVARNIAHYAGEGEITLEVVTCEDDVGIQVVAHDDGPGIADLDLALSDGYSTAHSMGLGLPGARRLVDSFAIESAPGEGTTVTMLQWRHEQPGTQSHVGHSPVHTPGRTRRG